MPSSHGAILDGDRAIPATDRTFASRYRPNSGVVIRT